MRITEQERDIIIETVQTVAPNASVYLYGSRTDDRKRGGDIDLLVLSDLDKGFDYVSEPLAEYQKADLKERSISTYAMQKAYFEQRLYDEDYWKAYFDQLAQSRFNNFHKNHKLSGPIKG